MKIGIIAPPWLPVPPPAYGGTEAVIDDLARGFVADGHDVHLFTSGDSSCAVTRSWVFPVGVTPMNDFAAEFHHVQSAYEQLTDVDVIHDHTLIGPAIARTKIPIVVTMHGPMTTSTRLLCSRYLPNTTIVAISHAQRASAPETNINHVIHHGVDLRRIQFGDGGGGYLLFLGRMTPDKGVHDAISIAARAGKQLIIAAKMREAEEREYFRERVQPRLKGDVHYVGEVAADEKQQLLREALALVNPIQWPEPFGLVMIESLASGTPVIAYRGGSPSEIVDHGRTGFLCRTIDEAATGARLAKALDRHACRRAVRDRFTVDRMVHQYEELFEQVVTKRAREVITIAPEVITIG